MAPNPGYELYKQIVKLAFHEKKKTSDTSVEFEPFLKDIFKNCNNVSWQSQTFVPKVCLFLPLTQML